MTKRRLAAVASGILALTLVCLFVDGSFSLRWPSTALTVIVCAASLLSCTIVWLSGGFKKAAIKLLPYIVVLLLLEGGCRIWVSYFLAASTRPHYLTAFTAAQTLGSEGLYVPHHYTLYNLNPKLNTPDGTRHNHLGMRDHRDLRDKKDTVRIVFIGGSTTYSTAIKDNKKLFTFRLERMLNKHYSDMLGQKHIEVVNAGMGAATSAENLLRLVFFISEIHPDLVVIQHGLNDVWPRVNGKIVSDYSNYRKRWEPPNYFRHRPIAYGILRTTAESSVLLTFVTRQLKIAGLSFPTVGAMVTRSNSANEDASDEAVDYPGLSDNGTEYFERNTRYMIAVCRAMGARVMLSTEPYTRNAGKARVAAMPQHNDVLAKIATDEREVGFFDFCNEMTKDDAHMPDGRHVSQVGSDLKAQLYFNSFIEQNLVPALLEE